MMSKTTLINCTEKTYRRLGMPLHVEGFMQLNDSKKQFNFLTSLDIANINEQVESIHPSTHEFWEREDIKKELMSYLKEFSRNSKAYNKQTSKEVEESTKSYLRGDFEDIEVGFVDGLFEMCKLRELIAKTKAEIISDGMAR